MSAARLGGRPARRRSASPSPRWMGHALLLAACTLKGHWAVDEALVASNACVGGPATAAAFASATRREDLVVPAVVWGTVGYAARDGPRDGPLRYAARPGRLPIRQRI